MLSIQNLSVSIANKTILDSVSLDIPDAGVFAIVGPNGAGKSTFLRAAAGLIPTHADRLYHKEYDLLSLPRMERARIIAYLPQSMPSVQGYRVEEFVSLATHPWNHIESPQTSKQRLEYALELCHIEEFRNRKLSTLSGGERQRVYLAQVIVQNTPVIFLDEPTVFLDLKHQIIFEDILVKLYKTGKLILYVSHDLHSARRIATQVAALYQGRILAQGNPQDVLNPTLICQLFDTSEAIVRQWYGNSWPIH